jgi:Tfp pilus assembly protein PilP
MKELDMRELMNKLGENDGSIDSIHDKAIDLLDDILDSLGEEERYGEKGDILRYALKRLQEVGLGR